MSLRLTRKGFISSVYDDPAMRGLNAYLAGRRTWRDDAGHGGGGGGTAESGDDADPAGEDGNDTDDGVDNEDDTDAKDGNKKDKKDDKDDDEEVVPKWKLEKLHKRMTAADQRASALQKELDTLKSSKDINADVKRELDEIKSKVSTVEAERDKIAGERDDMRIKLAFTTLDAGVGEWVDVDTALKLVDVSDVDISDDGKVDKRALKSAMKALAKEKPYLLKPKSTKDDAQGEGNENGGGGSANPMNGRRKGSKNAPDAEALKSRFPALARINH